MMSATTRQATDAEIRKHLIATIPEVDRVSIRRDGWVRARHEMGHLTSHAERGGSGTGLWYGNGHRASYRVHLKDGVFEHRWYGGQTPGPWTYAETGDEPRDPSSLPWPRIGMIGMLQAWARQWSLPGDQDHRCLVHLVSLIESAGRDHRACGTREERIAQAVLEILGEPAMSDEDLQAALARASW